MSMDKNKNGDKKTAVEPRRTEDFPAWYQQVIRVAELAETSGVRGCMVIKPWGFALWERIRSELDSLFKATGHVNAYFPLFIPVSYLEKEAQHVEGFAKECAVVTHHRLESRPGGGLAPAGELEEPLVVRPTSETIIGATYAKWVQSYRDLPILINQWANVVRWEMRTRLFLRTSEFLWQEGHTAHETPAEAWEETLKMLDVYKTLAEEYMAMPVISGEKTERERFPGAVNTFSIEAMMQDRKALQAGTSHFLGQNFAKASGIVFQTRNGTQEYAWTTSWGASTRLIGGLIMVHGDDDGMIMPPRIAPSHVALLPVIRSAKDEGVVMSYCHNLANELRGQLYHGRAVEVITDARDMNAGEKSWSWTKKGIPLLVEVGPREIRNNSVFIGRRDKTRKQRYSQNKDEFTKGITSLLDDIQTSLFLRAKAFLDKHTHIIDNYDDFKSFFTSQNKEKPEIHGGFSLSFWCGNGQCEEKVSQELGVTIRCIPSDQENQVNGRCIACGESSKYKVIFAKAY